MSLDDKKDLEIIHVSKEEKLAPMDPNKAKSLVPVIPYEEKYPQELRDRAHELHYFHVEPPQSIIQGITASEYNIAKGFIAGAAILVSAPFIGASEEMNLAPDSWQSQTEAFFTGFAKGFQRGVGGAVALSLTGSITGGNQFYLGVVKAKPNPGHGLNLEENWRHVVYTRYLELITNTEPANFQEELKFLIDEKILPEEKYDCNGVNIPYTYQFFMTDEPNDMVEGFGMLQYNAVKGFIAGATLAVSAPIVDAQQKFEDLDADYTDNHGLHLDAKQGSWEGGGKGFGQGAARGFVGGFLLAGAGLAYGAAQFGKGFVSLKNIPMIVDFSKKSSRDFEALKTEPIYGFIYQKGYGLEEFILEEDKRKEEEKKELAKLYAKRAAYRQKYLDTNGTELPKVEGADLFSSPYYYGNFEKDFPDWLYISHIDEDGTETRIDEPDLRDYPPKLRLPAEYKWVDRARRLKKEVDEIKRLEELKKRAEEAEVKKVEAEAEKAEN